MIRLRKLLAVAIGIELVAAVILISMRLGATRPDPPLVAAYHDALTGREILALPDRFRFDGTDKWRTLGEVYLAYGFFGKAEACLARAARADPRNAEIAFAYGFCLERLGKIPEANSEFLRAVATGNSRMDQECWYHIGRNHLRREQPAEAELAFLKAGELHFPSVFQRARLLVRHGRASEATPLIQRLAESHPRDLHVWQLRAQAALENGRDQDAADARDELERAVETLALNDTHIDLDQIRKRMGLAREILRARELWNSGAAAEAADRFLRLLDADLQSESSFPYLQQDAAAAQVSVGNLEVAKPLVERQFDELDFPTPIAWEMRGDIAFAEGRSDDAQTAWIHAVRMLPTADVYRKLARLAHQRNNESEYQHDLALAGQRMGVDYLQVNQAAKAKAIFREAIALDASLPDLWYFCGESERLLGDRTLAAAAYRSCLELEPYHGRALSALARLEKRRK
ncbi:MAG: tetratricopeptide repeat protein [Planctomycetia bacterium]|nr:tetratricopeptide repeat protein [Planctomycetia bacterium]